MTVGQTKNYSGKRTLLPVQVFRRQVPGKGPPPHSAWGCCARRPLPHPMTHVLCQHVQPALFVRFVPNTGASWGLQFISLGKGSFYFLCFPNLWVPLFLPPGSCGPASRSPRQPGFPRPPCPASPTPVSSAVCTPAHPRRVSSLSPRRPFSVPGRGSKQKQPVLPLQNVHGSGGVRALIRNQKAKSNLSKQINK